MKLKKNLKRDIKIIFVLYKISVYYVKVDFIIGSFFLFNKKVWVIVIRVEFNVSLVESRKILRWKGRKIVCGFIIDNVCIL